MAAGMIGERWRWVTVGFLALCLVIGLARKAFAEEPGAWGGIDKLAGQFEQTIIDTNGRTVSKSSGEFAVLRPHYLRWLVTAPGQQLLLSDGSYLWQYDLDLETLTRQPVDQGRRSPLRLLIESEDSLAEDYRISRTADSMTLEPRGEEPLFQSVTVRFEDQTPVHMSLVDNLGQTIEVALQVNASATPQPEDFHFDLEGLPEGVEFTAFEG